MKVVYIVLKGLPVGGGIEKYTEEIGSRLVQKGHEVVVYTMRHYGAKSGFYKGMRVKSVPALRTRSLEKLTGAFAATLRHCFEDNDADVIHFHAFGPAMFCAIPRLLGKKVVVQGHGLEWMRSKWGLGGKLFLKATEALSVKFPHALTVVSKVQQAYLREKYRFDSAYIPTGVNPPNIEKPVLIREYGLEGNDYILFTARLVSEKGPHYLIEAFKRINTGMKLVIAGDALHEAAYKSELKRLAGGDRNIIFTGFVTGKRLHELFSNCRFFVLPSEIEGLPTALLEAMSYGNCCLVSDIPENIEALNGLGYTFKSGNVDDLAEKLKFLAKEATGEDDLKSKVRSYVLENYSWDDIAERFEDLYHRVSNGDMNGLN